MYLDELTIGQTASLAKTITEADILLFSAVSTDTNPVHVNAEYAKTTIFGERIAHGMLSASLISAALANKLPGAGTIYLGQSLKFTAPVKIGETVEARLEIIGIDDIKGKVSIRTQCYVGDKIVIDGEALVIAPKRPQ